MTERLRTNPYASYHHGESRRDSQSYDEGLGTKKTMLVIVVVVGCFAVLWPKLFYPMLVNSANKQMKPGPVDKTTGCCDVISELDVDTIKIMSELCSTIIDKGGIKPPSPQEIVTQCRKAVLETCGIDISAALQDRISLGHSAKQILEEVRSLNGSLCLKYNFGLSPWMLGVPHRVHINLDPLNSIRQERPSHLRPEMVHPAFRERGRAIPQPESSGITKRSSPAPRIVEGRPGPIPGMRPAMGGPGHMVSPSKQTNYGYMGVLMPIYTVGFVVFFTYTVMKLVFKKKTDVHVGAPLYPPCDSDEQFHKEVFEANKGYYHRPSRDSTIVVNAVSALLEEVNQELEARKVRTPETVPEQDEMQANGSVPKEDEQGSVTVMAMETTACSESGKKWSRPDSPALPHPHPVAPKEPSPPPQQIFLEGSLPPQSQILVADSATEAQKDSEEDSPVVLAGKMTLSVISLDSETGTEDSIISGKKVDFLDEERRTSSSNVSDEFEKINTADLEDQINNIIEEAENIALTEENRYSLNEELDKFTEEIPRAPRINEKDKDNDVLEEIKNQLNLEDDLLLALTLQETETEGKVGLPVADIIKEFLTNEENALLGEAAGLDVDDVGEEDIEVLERYRRSLSEEKIDEGFTPPEDVEEDNDTLDVIDKEYLQALETEQHYLKTELDKPTADDKLDVKLMSEAELPKGAQEEKVSIENVEPETAQEGLENVTTETKQEEILNLIQDMSDLVETSKIDQQELITGSKDLQQKLVLDSGDTKKEDLVLVQEIDKLEHSKGVQPNLVNESEKVDLVKDFEDLKQKLELASEDIKREDLVLVQEIGNLEDSKDQPNLVSEPEKVDLVKDSEDLQQKLDLHSEDLKNEDSVLVQEVGKLEDSKDQPNLVSEPEKVDLVQDADDLRQKLDFHSEDSKKEDSVLGQEVGNLEDFKDKPNLVSEPEKVALVQDSEVLQQKLDLASEEIKKEDSVLVQQIDELGHSKDQAGPVSEPEKIQPSSVIETEGQPSRVIETEDITEEVSLINKLSVIESPKSDDVSLTNELQKSLELETKDIKDDKASVIQKVADLVPENDQESSVRTSEKVAPVTETESINNETPSLSEREAATESVKSDNQSLVSENREKNETDVEIERKTRESTSEERNGSNKADLLLQGLMVKDDEDIADVPLSQPALDDQKALDGKDDADKQISVEAKDSSLNFSEEKPLVEDKASLNIDQPVAGGLQESKEETKEENNEQNLISENSNRDESNSEGLIDDEDYDYSDNEELTDDEVRDINREIFEDRRESMERRLNGEDADSSRNGAGNSETAAENEISEDEDLENDDEDEEIEEIIEYVDNSDEEGVEIIEINGNEQIHRNGNGAN